MLDEALVPEPDFGRVYRAERRVRLGDADPAGRLRFDACARYLHDVSNDDTRDSGLIDDGSWVVRRTVLDVTVPPRFLERLSLATWCGGTGSRWAERRVSVAGVKGGRVEAASLWVYVDLASMMPRRLPESFLGLYGEASGGRSVGSRLVLPAPSSDGADRRPWVLRRTDFDILDHVNNAAYWVVLEELAGERPDLVAAPHRAVCEFAKPIASDDEVDVVVRQTDTEVSAWLVARGTDKPHAALRLSLSSQVFRT